MTADEADLSPAPSHWRTQFWAVWSIVAAFGTYFCMYAFRKPFTAAGYDGLLAWGVDYKTVIVTAQTLGYMVSKFIGIKVVAEMPPHKRAWSILLLIGAAEFALLLFGVLPRPWNTLCLFLNGLPLGMVFGLVLGFLEGRKQTELLTAGLCASFILADGVTKSLGAALVQWGIPVVWMPFTAGLLAAPLLTLFVWMLTCIPAPTRQDVAARSHRATMDRQARWSLYLRYAPGLTILVGIYLLVTIMRSLRADFAKEIWLGLLSTDAAPALFTYSETWVAFIVLVVCGATVLIRDNRRAFFAALLTAGAGLCLITVALLGQQMRGLSPFVFMVLLGLGLYLPYVAIHTTVFERMLAMTREKGTISYLMYVADAFGYLGYVAVMFSRQWVSKTADFLDFFVAACWLATVLSALGLIYAWSYFSRRCPAPQYAAVPIVEGAT